MNQAPKKVRNARPRCVECGRFIGLGEMADGSACFRLTPDHAFGPEVVEWTCRRCAVDFGRLLNHMETGNQTCRSRVSIP